MIDKIVFATGNQDKMVEIRQILADINVPILSLKDVGISADIVEDGSTFEENAIIKAKEIWKLTGGLVLADDSGLEIDYLDKAPGIYSARYMGEDTSYAVKNQSFIDKLQGVAEEERTARFVCAIAAVYPDGRVVTTHGVMEGHIAHVSAGANGFGYDPVFYLPEYGCTSAELSKAKKNELSHRGKALRAMRDRLYADFNSK
ncbi:MAG: RdgB/HAM1 family non-canonical purine NTP pyrophosphatase [Lachnospiraceae bacterium]